MVGISWKPVWRTLSKQSPFSHLLPGLGVSHRRRISIHHEDCYATRSSSSNGSSGSSSSTREYVARTRRAHRRGTSRATQPPLPSRSRSACEQAVRHPPSVWKIGKKSGNTWWMGIPRARIRVDTLPPRRISRPTSSTNYTGVTVGQRLELQAIRDTTAVEYELHRGNRELWNSGGTEGGTKEGGAEPVEEKIDLPPLGNV